MWTILLAVTAPLQTVATEKATANPPEGEMAAVQQAARMYQTADFAKLLKMVEGWKKQTKVMQKHLVHQLAQHLDSTKPLKLENYADMTVARRLVSGKMTFPGHGVILRQDIFLKNGRSAWAIEQFLKTKLPTFSEKMSKKDLAKAVRGAHLQIIRAMTVP